MAYLQHPSQGTLKRPAEGENGANPLEPPLKRPCVDERVPEIKKQHLDLADSEEDSASDSGSDNPRHLDYFFADSFLDEEFDPSEIYSLNDIQDDNDPEYTIQRTRLHLETLLSLYRLEAARLKDILETKHCKFLRLQNQQLQKFNKSHRRPTGLAAAADQAKSQQQKKLDRIYGNFHGLRPARVSLITKTCPNVEMTHYEQPPPVIPQQEQKLETSRNCPTCSEKTLPGMNYCFNHILSDPAQKLYGRCQYQNFATKQQCTVPYLISPDPPFCQAHLDTIIIPTRK